MADADAEGSRWVSLLIHGKLLHASSCRSVYTHTLAATKSIYNYKCYPRQATVNVRKHVVQICIPKEIQINKFQTIVFQTTV